MKFGKNPSNQIEETLPEWRDKFLSYKDLKRRLKLFSVAERPAKRSKVADEGAAGDNAPSSTAVEEEEFVSLLEAELDKFNTFFVEKEEEYIIRQKISGLVKILKKYDSRSSTISFFSQLRSFYMNNDIYLVVYRACSGFVDDEEEQ